MSREKEIIFTGNFLGKVEENWFSEESTKCRELVMVCLGFAPPEEVKINVDTCKFFF